MGKYVSKKHIAKTEKNNYHVQGYRHSKIYLSQMPIPACKDDIHLLNVIFSNMFSYDDSDKDADIKKRLNSILWGAEGLVVIEGKSQTISKTIAKEVSLALHLDLPVWVVRGYKLEPVYAVIKEWIGVKENENKWATLIIEGEDIPKSTEAVLGDNHNRKPFKLN